MKKHIVLATLFALLSLIVSCSNPTGSTTTTTTSTTPNPLYVTNNGSTSLSAYSIGTGGAFTAITTGTLTTGRNPVGIAISPNGNYLYVTNKGSPSGASGLSAYSIGTGGALTALSTATYTTGPYPSGIAILP